MGEPATITRALRVEIAKPLNATWEELGTTLRTQRRIMPQLLRAGMDARIACGVVTAKVAKKTLRIEADGQTASTVVYQSIKKELARIQKGKWPVECRPALELATGTISALSQRVSQTYKKRPSFGGDQPIPVRAQESGLELREGAVILKAKLRSKGHYHLLVKAGKGSHWSRLKGLASGTGKLGQVSIKRDPRNTRKWYAFISYTVDRPPRPTACRPEHVMVLHRGQRNLLTCMTSEGRFLVLATGNALRAQKRAFKRRREQLQARSYAERGAGQRGHGRKRRYATPEALSAAEAACVKTLCQQIGARVRQLALEWGCGKVLIEDYGGVDPDRDRGKRMVLERFPNYQLKEAIGNALEPVGVELGEYPHEHISTTCPVCGNREASQHNYRTGVFHCKLCGFERPVDWVSSLHAMRRAAPDRMEVWDKRMAAENRLADGAKTRRREPQDGEEETDDDV